MGKMFRLLKAEEIECRPATITKKGVSLLLYKDSRVDQNILDETAGPMNWQRSHSRDNANCSVGLWDREKEQWVWKEDTGTESYTEKEKGLASDSFKRACFNWGIGRELYTAPFIWISVPDVNIEEGKNGKLTTYDHFTLKDIDYDGDKISRLEIVNDKLKRTVYTYGKLTSATPKIEKPEEPKKYVPNLVPKKEDGNKPATIGQTAQLDSICKETGVPSSFVAQAYKVDNLTDLTRVQAYSAVNNFDMIKQKYEQTLEGIPFK